MMNPQQEIESLLLSVEKKPRKGPKLRYKKSQVIKDFEQEYKAWQYSGRNISEHYQALTKFRDDRAKDLTKLIIAYLKVQGAFATRLNSSGIYHYDLD